MWTKQSSFPTLPSLPRLRFVGFRPSHLSYWGSIFRVVGAAAFVLASTSNWMYQVVHIPGPHGELATELSITLSQTYLTI